ncbi:MAG: peptide ABC transporter permease [Gammaproteobacteria bacterium]|nr:peptide ABC transporter permease [Gammaproteobacteria bacterium]
MNLNSRIVIGGIILFAFIFMGMALPWFAPNDPMLWQTVPRNRTPSLEHLLGTTSQGQDIFWLLTWAIRNSLWLGIVVATFATAIGVMLGLFSGYVGGLTDRIVSFVIDATIVIPVLPVLILIAAIMLGQTTLWMLAIVLVVFNWPFPARQVRAVALSLREHGFVQTAWMSGESRVQIVIWQFLPHLRAWTAANFVNTVLVATVLETSVAVIGLSKNDTATLGTMLYWALEYQAILAERWWWIGAPVIAIILLFIGLFLLSSGIEERSALIRGKVVPK